MQRRRFPNSPGSVSAARRFALAALPPLPGQICDDVELMVSELVTNALVHAGTELVVEAGYDEHSGTVRVAVGDDGLGQPAVRRPSPADPHGRGLQIVAMLASGWGVDPQEGGAGKTVWFEVRLADRVAGAGR